MTEIERLGFQLEQIMSLLQDISKKLDALVVPLTATTYQKRRVTI